MENWKVKTEETILELKYGENNVPYLSYPILEQTGVVRHGFSTREGGVSEGIFSSMNLSFSRGDNPKAVEENFKRFARAICVKPENMVFSKQTHTANVRKVIEKDKGKGFLKPTDYDDVDGLITNVPGICLVTFYADCVPLFFVDPVKKVIGLSHSGWRGTVRKIGLETVKKMQKEYQSRPEDILACVGPSICQDCYEVSKDVIEEFKTAFSKETWGKLFYEKENKKYQLNLWKANELVFQEAGILPEHMAVTNICTQCNKKNLYSHRATNGKRGSLAAFLALKEENRG